MCLDVSRAHGREVSLIAPWALGKVGAAPQSLPGGSFSIAVLWHHPLHGSQRSPHHLPGTGVGLSRLSGTTRALTPSQGGWRLMGVGEKKKNHFCGDTETESAMRRDRWAAS